jgi:hypothetical protein
MTTEPKIRIRIETYQDWERLFINGKCVQEHHHINEDLLHELLVYLGAEVVIAGNDGYPIHDYTDEIQDGRDYWDGETFANEDLDDYTPVTERLDERYADRVVQLDDLLRILPVE